MAIFEGQKLEVMATEIVTAFKINKKSIFVCMSLEE